MLKPIPPNLKTDFLVETQSDAMPEIQRDGANVLYPAFVRMETIVDPETGEERKNYRFFIVPVAYTGQQLDDPQMFEMENYAPLRKHFYGPLDVQAELRDDNAWEAHRQAVRSSFPKAVGEINTSVLRFEAICSEFWGMIDKILLSKGMTRDDLPKYPFFDDDMYIWADKNNVSAELVEEATALFVRVAIDLHVIGRNWTELFA